MSNRCWATSFILELWHTLTIWDTQKKEIHGHDKELSNHIERQKLTGRGQISKTTNTSSTEATTLHGDAG